MAAKLEAVTDWNWMPRYIELRLADPSGSPLAAMAQAKKEVEGKAA